MNTMRTIVFVVLAGFVTACNPAPAALTEGDKTAIRKATDEFTKQLVAGDRAAMMKLYTEDATLMPPNAPSVTGRSALEATLKEFPKVTEMAFTLEEIDGRGDLAFVRGGYTMTVEVPGAPGPIPDKGKFVEIRRKQPDGSWPIAVDIFNSDLPPEVPAPPLEPPSGP